MAYASSLPFGEIRDFRDAEINGIPALFTMYRLDPETFAQIFTRVRSWAAVAAIFSGSCRWL